MPSHSPSSSLPSLSTIHGSIPKNGFEAEPGFNFIAPVWGEINIPPVSVCHQVSTIGQLELPGTSKYHFHASGFIGSPTVPKSFYDDLLVLVS